MADKPILFSAPMVNAILRGAKYQTRRVIKPQPPSNFRLWGRPIDNHFAWTDHPTQGEKGQVINLDCPICVGDMLWVRESFQLGRASRDADGQGIARYVDGSFKLHPDLPIERMTWCREWRRKPSIFMPRWASRITLRVISVRAQRVQDISEDDAAAEGIERHSGPYILDFAKLWDSINGKRGYSWNSNPWVFAYTFEVTA